MDPRRFALLTGVVLWLAAIPCIAFDGRVIDEPTQQPLAGVFVVVNRLASMPYAGLSCISFNVAQSDAEGRFSVSLPAADLLIRIIGRTKDLIGFYKPGYRFTGPTGESQTFVAHRDLRPFAERYEEMSATAGRTECAPGEEKNEKAVPLLRAMYDDLRATAITPADRESARNWLLRIDIAKYGGIEGFKRMKARDADFVSRCIRVRRCDPMTGKCELVVREGVDTSDCEEPSSRR